MPEPYLLDGQASNSRCPDHSLNLLVVAPAHRGAGKTSLAQLLMRFWDPEKGSITLNGIELRDYKFQSRSMIS